MRSETLFVQYGAKKYIGTLFYTKFIIVYDRHFRKIHLLIFLSACFLMQAQNSTFFMQLKYVFSVLELFFFCCILLVRQQCCSQKTKYSIHVSLSLSLPVMKVEPQRGRVFNTFIVAAYYGNVRYFSDFRYKEKMLDSGLHFPCFSFFH